MHKSMRVAKGCLSNGVFTADGKRAQSKKGTHDPED